MEFVAIMNLLEHYAKTISHPARHPDYISSCSKLETSIWSYLAVCGGGLEVGLVLGVSDGRIQRASEPAQHPRDPAHPRFIHTSSISLLLTYNWSIDLHIFDLLAHWLLTYWWPIDIFSVFTYWPIIYLLNYWLIYLLYCTCAIHKCKMGHS